MSSNLKDILDQIEQESLQEKAPQPAPQAKAKAVVQPSRLVEEQENSSPSYDTQESSYEEIHEDTESSYEQNKQRRRRRKRSVSSNRAEKNQSRILLYAALALCTAILVSAFFIVRAMYQQFDKRDRVSQQKPAPRRTNSAAQPAQSDQSVVLPSVMLAPEDKSKELFNPDMFGLPKDEEEDKGKTEKKQSN